MSGRCAMGKSGLGKSASKVELDHGCVPARMMPVGATGSLVIGARGSMWVGVIDGQFLQLTPAKIGPRYATNAYFQRCGFLGFSGGILAVSRGRFRKSALCGN